jgi:Lar family restriction alleviation protein
MSEKIKPCPFCGEMAVLDERMLSAGYTVMCVNPDCPACPATIRIEYDKERCIAAWNTRKGEAKDED